MADQDADVLEAKQVVGRRARRPTVFAGPQEKIVGENETVACGRQTGRGWCAGGERISLADEGQRCRFDSCRWRVRALPRVEQSLKAIVELAEGVQARVNGPHPGERLRHLADGVLHCPSANRPVAGGDATGAILLGEDE